MIAIEVLVAREKRAEANKRTAEEGYREAWWDTTMALGALTDRRERLDACTLVAKTLGQKSDAWSRDRAKTGKAFIEANIPVHGLPPKMATVLALSKVGVTEETVAYLRKAEGEMSIREYSRSVTGKSWSDTAAGASGEKIQEIFDAQPEAVAKMVADDPAMLKAVQKVHWDRLEEEHDRQPMVVLEDRSWKRTTIGELISYTQRLRRETIGENLTDQARANIRWIIAELTAISEGDEFIGELESWLEEATTR